MHLLRLGGGIGLSTEVGRGRSAREEAAQHRLEERVEDNLSAVGLGERHPQNEDELEDVVEGEPVGGIDGTLNNSEEGVNNPVRQPLSIICLARGEHGIERVVARNQETGKVDEELASDVEEDQEGVDSDQAEDDIDLRNGGLALQVVEDRVLGEL
jgi:hypothetical protein